MSILDWPDALRSVGLPVLERPGWRTNRPKGNLSSPLQGVFWHHDATPSGATPGGWGWIQQSYDAGNPSAQIWVDYVGQWRFAGSGYASHAGVVRGPLTSSNCVGIESDHTANEAYSPTSLASIRRGLAAVCKVEGRNSDFVTFHKIEATPQGRKQDPWFKPGFDYSVWRQELAQERIIIQGYINGAVPPPPPPPPPEEEDEMKEEDFVRLEAMVDRQIDKRIRIHFGVDAVQNPEAALNAGFMPRLELNMKKWAEEVKNQ